MSPPDVAGPDVAHPDVADDQAPRSVPSGETSDGARADQNVVETEGDEGDDTAPAPGRIAAITERIDKGRQDAIDRLESYETRWPPVRIGRSFVSRYLDVNGVVLAGHLAFRSFTFLLPLAFVVVALAGLATNFGHDPGATADEQLKLGSALASSLRDAGSEASQAPYHVATASAIALLLGSLGMLSGLNYVFARAWQVDQRKVLGKWRKLWRFVLAFTFLLIIAVGSSALRKSGFVWGAAGTAGVLVTFFIAFLGLGLMMPRRCDRWTWLVPGAVVGTLGMVGLHALATFYFPDKLATLSKTYGALALAVVLLSYLFMVGQIIVASAVASAVWYDHFRPDDNPVQPGDRGPALL